MSGQPCPQPDGGRDSFHLCVDTHLGLWDPLHLAGGGEENEELLTAGFYKPDL